MQLIRMENMKEHKGDLWELVERIQNYGKEPPLIMVPTNGYVKKNGRGVAGAGVAKQARDRFEDFDLALGQALTERGNVVSYLGTWNEEQYKFPLFSFPTKTHWRSNSDTDLIRVSMQYTKGLAEKIPSRLILIPRPGCGNGNLSWETSVKEIVEEFYHERMIIVSK